MPAHVDHGADRRTLGVCVSALTIDDGFGTPRSVLADDPRLCLGFHANEPGPQRWTARRARLPTELWYGVAGALFLRTGLARPASPRWVAPVSSEASKREPEASRLRLVI